MTEVDAIYQNGVFKPLQDVGLPENQRVRPGVQPVEEGQRGRAGSAVAADHVDVSLVARRRCRGRGDVQIGRRLIGGDRGLAARDVGLELVGFDGDRPLVAAAARGRDLKFAFLTGIQIKHEYCCRRAIPSNRIIPCQDASWPNEGLKHPHCAVPWHASGEKTRWRSSVRFFILSRA